MDTVTGNIAKLLVVGIGGGGGNAVNAMVQNHITDVEFLAMNTDKQALSSMADGVKRFVLGEELTKGLGAGANPDIGRQAAEESRETIRQILEGTDLLFIAAGMGGGTGTGAAPIVSQIARELGILTIAVVTKPFNFEGTRRMRFAEEGIENLKKNVDALVIVQNEKLNRDKNFSIKDAFTKADEILMQGIRGITEIVVQNGRINLDLNDVKCAMRDSGMAHMGIGEGKGKNKTIDAIRKAVYSPLSETTIQGAANLMINFRGGDDLTLDEVTVGVDLVKQVISPNANVLFGMAFDDSMKDEVRVTLIATGFSGENDAKAAFFGSEASTNAAAESMKRRAEASSVAAATVNPIDTVGKQSTPQPGPAPSSIPRPSNPLSGTISVEEDKNIPPFLRKMKG